MTGLIILGVVVVVGVATFFVRRHGESDRPQADWRATSCVAAPASASDIAAMIATQ